VLTIALANAGRDPDGQVFPWRDGYPLAGSTVYHDGNLWTVVDKDEPAAPEGFTSAMAGTYGVTAADYVPGALLVGTGHDGQLVAPIADLRPVTWSQAQEIALEHNLAGEPSQTLLDALDWRSFEALPGETVEQHRARVASLSRGLENRLEQHIASNPGDPAVATLREHLDCDPLQGYSPSETAGEPTKAVLDVLSGAPPAGLIDAQIAAALGTDDDEQYTPPSYDESHSYTRNAHTCVGGDGE
jgi:hypothetical protein